MLNVTCGDVAARALREARIDGEVLPWRDVLHEGPVPGDVTRRELRDIRAGFIAGQGWADFETTREFFRERDHALERAAGEGADLWFEADLYDQLQLIEVLAILADHGARPEAIRLFQGDVLPGLDRESLMGALKPLTEESLQAASLAWEAFRSPEPEGLKRMASRSFPGLPFLVEALERLMAEYPWRADGLSRTERTLLNAAGRGATGSEIFRKASAAEERSFLGDAVCWLSLARLSSGPTPLLQGGGGNFAASRVALTPAGRAVIEGTADWMDLGGAGRWIGGVRLSSRPDWRYHETEKTVALRSGREERS